MLIIYCSSYHSIVYYILLYYIRGDAPLVQGLPRHHPAQRAGAREVRDHRADREEELHDARDLGAAREVFRV